jgi:hypothetical protein
MPATVHHNSMGYKTVVTTDRYGTERTYRFKPPADGIAVQPQDGYTPVVLQALWNEGIPVDWSPDDLTANERAQLDGFCNDCGSAIREVQVGPSDFNRYCPECDNE